MSLLDRFVSELSYYDRISCNQMIRRLHWECSVSRCERQEAKAFGRVGALPAHPLRR